MNERKIQHIGLLSLPPPTPRTNMPEKDFKINTTRKEGAGGHGVQGERTNRTNCFLCNQWQLRVIYPQLHRKA
jgi:hypothetical protein